MKFGLLLLRTKHTRDGLRKTLFWKETSLATVSGLIIVLEKIGFLGDKLNGGHQ